MDGIWLTCAREKLEKTKQIGLGFSKLLKILIGDENKENKEFRCFFQSYQLESNLGELFFYS